MRKVSSSCLSTTWLSQILSNSVRGLLISPDPADRGRPARGPDDDGRAIRYYDFFAFLAFFGGAASAPSPATPTSGAGGSGAAGPTASRARSGVRRALPVRPRR